jgi:hypothetical protein
MTIEEAIKKAYEGGWKPKEFKATRYEFATAIIVEGNPFEDASFWQSLAKALGWGENWGNTKNPCLVDYDIQFRALLMKPSDDPTKTGVEEQIKWEREKNITAMKLRQALNAILETPWQFEWHRFIDHLAGGKTAESFFEILQ